MTYLNRLLQDIGIGGIITPAHHGHQVSLTYYYSTFIRVDKDDCVYYYCLSDILIKNAYKIAELFGRQRDYMRGFIDEEICNAIRVDKLEFWASSLYNNK